MRMPLASSRQVTRSLLRASLCLLLATGLAAQPGSRVVHLRSAWLSNHPNWVSNEGTQLGIDRATGELIVTGCREGPDMLPAIWRVVPGASFTLPTMLGFTSPAPISHTTVSHVSPDGRFAMGHLEYRPINTGLDYLQPVIWDLSQAIPQPQITAAPQHPDCFVRGYPLGVATAIANDGTLLVRDGHGGSGTMRRDYATGVFTPIGDVPGTPPSGTCPRVEAVAMSGDGRVIGGIYLSAETSPYWPPVRWIDQDPAEPLSFHPMWGAVTDVSADGSILAGVSPHDATFVNCEAGAVIWVDGVRKAIPFPPGYTGSRCGRPVLVADNGFVVQTVWGTTVNDRTLLIGRASWPSMMLLEDWFQLEGITLPYPGFPGLTARPTHVLDIASDETHLHLVVDGTNDTVGGRRSFLVSVPVDRPSAVATSFTLPGVVALLQINQDLSRARTTVFSLATGLGAVGTGPLLGLHDTDVTPLILQATAPLGVDPFHLMPTAPSEAVGSYVLPPGLELDVLSFSGSWPLIEVATEVHRFRVP